jgi:5'(3')-deoxyribonucleotidase
MKKIVVDLDDVLAIDGYLNMMNAFVNGNYKYEDAKGYYVEEVLDKETLKAYREFFKNNNVYDYATVAEGSKEVLMNLMTEYEIYICSSYYSEIDHIIMPELIPKKCEFLSRNYPFLTSKNFIFTNDKSMVEADIKIDDVLHNLENADTKILFSAYHNRKISGYKLSFNKVVRVGNWQGIEKILSKQKVKSRI